MKSPAGTEKLVAELANRIDPRAFETHVVCFEPSDLLAGLAPYVQTAVFPLSGVFSVAGFIQVNRFRRYLRRNRIRVIHSYMNRSAVFGALGAVGSGCHAVISSRLNVGYWYTPKTLRLFRMVNLLTTHILTNSAFAKTHTIKMEKIASSKISIFYQGVDLARFAPGAASFFAAASLGIPPGSRVVGIVAHFRAVKDLPLFLRSARLVADRVPDSAFLLVGQGELKATLEQLICDLHLEGRAFFSDPQVAVADYLRSMAIACLSSESEGLPNAILEYMAAGLPVVATDVGGISELVTDGQTGYLVRERTPEAFAAPLIRLLQDEPLRAALGQRGLERARRDFDMTAAVRRLEEFYRNASAGIYPR